MALLLAFAVLLPFSTGGTVAAQDADPDASVRFLHASPDAPEVDVLVDGLVVAEGLSFGISTEFAPLTDGEHQVQVVPAGEDAAAAVLDETIDVDSDHAYTVAVANRLNELELVTIESNIESLSDSSQSRVRVVNLSPDSGEMDMFQTGGDQWFDNTDFLEVSDHRDVDSGPYNLEFRPNESDQVSVAIEGVEIGSGQEYTFVLLGLTENASLTVLPLSVTVSASCNDTLGLESQDDAACIRVTHAAAGTEAVDVYFEDSLIAEAVESGNFVDFQALPSDDEDSTVKFVSTGGSPDDPIAETSFDPSGGSAYDVILGGSADDLKAVHLEVDLSPLPESQSRVRLIHLAPDTEHVDVVLTDGEDLFNDIGFDEATDNIVFDAGTYDVQVRQAGGNEVYLRVESLEIESGLAYTLLAYGSADDGSFAVLVLSAPVSVRTGDVADMTAEGTSMAEQGEAGAIEAGTPEPVASAQPD